MARSTGRKENSDYEDHFKDNPHFNSKRSKPFYENDEKELKDEFDYDQDLSIDLFNLEFEWAEHPRLTMKYSKESALANKRAKLADERVKTLRSQLVKEANSNPSVMGKDVKPTAPNVEAYYRDHPDYKEVKKACIEAEYYADLMTGVVFAFQARKSALENEVKLHLQEYNSELHEPRDVSPEAIERWKEEKSKSVQNRIKDKMKRKL